MNIQASKLELMQLILNIDNDKFIARIASFIHKESSDFWDDLSALEQSEIKKGIEQLNEGKRMNFNKFMKEVS